MNRWQGAAAVCVNSEKKLLMVLQGKPDERKRWSITSGGLEKGETIEQCCERETFEETRYVVEILKRHHVKEDDLGCVAVRVDFFL